MAVYVRNIEDELKLFRAALRRSGPGWTHLLKDLNRGIARHVVEKSEGMTETAQQSKAFRDGSPLAPKGTVRFASIRLTGRPPFADGAMFGAKQYKQFPPWVGNTWEIGGGGGPVPLNPAIRETKDDIAQGYVDGFEYMASVLIRAFPDGLPPKKPRYMRGSGTF